MRTRSPQAIGGTFLTVAFLTLPALAAPPGERSSKEEIAFGIEVARRGLWEEARFRFEQAAKAKPDSPSALNNLAVALEQQGEFEKAKAAYERALELDPKNISIQQNYDLFREADEKRNRKTTRPGAPVPRPAAAPEPAPPSPTPAPTPSEEALR